MNMKREIQRVILTGGSGFIGSNVAKHFVNDLNIEVLNIDKLTYAGNEFSNNSLKENQKYNFLQLDICNYEHLQKAFLSFKPTQVLHLAAESHVDRSIDGPKEFIETNIVGTFNLLECSRKYFNNCEDQIKKNFIFHHISTDEVYGDLSKTDSPFEETNCYKPSSPYSASKASSDHLVKAWGRTFGLPVVVTNCSNNYGPFQFPEKLIPLSILNAINGRNIRIYGKGDQIRDWLYVLDHARALHRVLQDGTPGEIYNIGGKNELENIEVIKLICDILDKLKPPKNKDFKSYNDLITFVPDRPGHDQRYAINANKIEKKLGWTPKETFKSGLRKTIEWYLSNNEWIRSLEIEESDMNRKGVSS